MKFNPRSLRVWLTYIVAGANLMLGIVRAYITPRRKHRPTRILLSGHHFYGDLRALYERTDWAAHGMECRFLYIDHLQYRKYRRRWPGIMSSFRPDHMAWAASADAIISDRGLGLLDILIRLRPRVRTFGTWHGVGFKSHPPKQYAYFRRFTGFFAPSERFRDAWHRDGLGPALEQIKMTGSPRTDALVDPRVDAAEIAAEFDLGPVPRKLVLIAPTWRRAGGPLLDSDRGDRQFFTRVGEWAESRDVKVVFRAHLNTVVLGGWKPDAAVSEASRGVVFRSMSDYPLTERLLLLADVLVTDWSSIGTDFLVLDRPIIYLDGPWSPTGGWGVLDRTDRPGPLVATLASLFSFLDRYLDDPDSYRARYRSECDRVRAKAFDGTLDGRSSERCLDEVIAALRQ